MTDSAPAAPSRRHSRLAGVLGVVAVLAIVLATLVGSVHAVVLSPDTLTTIVTPVGESPEVQAAVSSKAAASIVDALGVEAKAEQVLGSRVGPLVAPSISRAAQDRLASVIADALASPQFAARWEQIVHATSTVAINVLKGDSTAITTSNGTIYLNLIPAIGGTLDALKAQGIIDPSVQLPDLSSPTTPAQETIAKLSSLLGISLPPDFGQVPIAQTTALVQVQGLVATFDSVTVLLIVVAVALAAAAVALAGDRRRMVVLIGIWSALLLAVVPPLLHLSESAVVDGVATPGMAVVVGSFVDAILGALVWPLRAVAAVCLGAALVGMIGGPGMHGFGTIARRPVAAVPLLIGAGAFVAVWLAVGPDAALLGLALVTAAIWVSGRPLVAPDPAPPPETVLPPRPA